MRSIPTWTSCATAMGSDGFSGNKPRLEAALRDYFRSRDEDAIEL